MQHDSSPFESAVDAIVAGDSTSLHALLNQNPTLPHARSPLPHQATLLHYTAANGVEDARQKTPPNITEIATLLLDAGAEVDATASCYGHPCTTLELAATSGHPERAGVQNQLLDTLLSRGATLTPGLIAACLANNRLAAAQWLSAHGAPFGFPEAAALNRIDLLQAETSPSPSGRDHALLSASQYGRAEAASWLLAQGADPAAANRQRQTPLHLAAMGAHHHTVDVLLKHHPPLEAENIYGGTPLGQALWSATHDDDPAKFLPTLAALAAAGARLPDPDPSSPPAIQHWLADQARPAPNDKEPGN